MIQMNAVIPALIGLYIGVSMRQVRDFKKTLTAQTKKLDELLAEIEKRR